MTQLKAGAVLWLWAVVAAAFVASAMSQAQDQGLVVPSIPASQENSPLANLWRQALRKQQPGTLDEPTVTTFLAPRHGEVINWVPQGSAHPLYVPEYQPLLHEILRDYMLAAEVKPDDPKLSEPSGYTVDNLNGKQVTFKKTDTGITVNDVPVESSKVNEDGTVSYIVETSLFGHREKVQQAWEENKKNNPPSNRFGFHGGPPPPRPPRRPVQ